MWVARDKDNSLWLFTDKPKRNPYTWTSRSQSTQLEIPMGLFTSLKWEDEPIEVYIYSSEYSRVVESERRFDWDKMFEYCRTHCNSFNECLHESNGYCDTVKKMFEICG